MKRYEKAVSRQERSLLTAKKKCRPLMKFHDNRGIPDSLHILQSLAGSRPEVSGGPAAQCYTEIGAKGRARGRQVFWNAGKKIRVADDGSMAVGQDSIYGSHDLWALPGKIESAKALLGSRQSPVKLSQGSGELKGPSPLEFSRGRVQTLKKVSLFHTEDPTRKDSRMKLVADCGMAAREVSGARARGETLKAMFKGKRSQSMTGKETNPVFMKYEIMIHHFGDAAGMLARELGRARKKKEAGMLIRILPDSILKAEGILRKFRKDLEATELRIVENLREWDSHYQAFLRCLNQSDKASREKAETLKLIMGVYKQAGEKYQARLKKMRTRLGKMAAQLERLKLRLANARLNDRKIKISLRGYEALFLGHYRQLKKEEKTLFDERTGINRFADPDIGGAYTISTGGDRKDVRKTEWEFHWAAVIMKAAGDNVTLENYANLNHPKNTDWRFQMYGVPKKGKERKGQSFHEQHRDVHRQHGTRPTTMATR